MNKTKVKKRGNKYYIQCTDGEIEYTEEEFEKIQKDLKAVSDYLEKWREKYAHQKWPTHSVPVEAETNLRMDMYFKEMGEALVKIFNEKIDTISVDEVERNLLEIIDTMALVYKKESINKLAQNYAASKYALKHLKVIRARIVSETKSARRIKGKPRKGQIQNLAFEDMFVKPEYAEPCLELLRRLDPPSIDANNNYIGHAKGVFPLWIKILKSAKPPLIKHLKDAVYIEALNKKIGGLRLSGDGSEFRKSYKRLTYNKVEVDIKTILSQLSQEGKLGK